MDGVVARLALVLVLLIAAFVCGYCLARLRAPAVLMAPAQPVRPPVPVGPGPAAPLIPGSASGGRVPPGAPGAPPPPPSPTPQTTVSPPTAPIRQPPPRPRSAALGERPLPPASSGNEDALVQGLIGAFDVAHDEAVQAHVAQVLQRNGIEKVVVPTGVMFDPASYEAVSTEKTSDPAKVKRVAATVRPGWKGPTGMVRSAQVAVWVAEQGNDGDGPQ